VRGAGRQRGGGYRREQGPKIIAKQVLDGLDWLWFLTGEGVADFGWRIGCSLTIWRSKVWRFREEPGVHSCVPGWRGIDTG